MGVEGEFIGVVAPGTPYHFAPKRSVLKEFQGFTTPDDGRKFTELYNVQHLASNKIDPVSKQGGQVSGPRIRNSIAPLTALGMRLELGARPIGRQHIAFQVVKTNGVFDCDCRGFRVTGKV